MSQKYSGSWEHRRGLGGRSHRHCCRGKQMLDEKVNKQILRALVS